MPSPFAPIVVDAIFSRFAAKGDRLYGEDVSELQHALQCAAFAKQFNEPDDLVAAALLHDYGHLMHDLGETIADEGIDAQHEELGARELAKWFPAKIVDPIRMHVDSKRYLCWKDRRYFDGLSAASRTSLAIQGGVMNDAQAQAFEKLPHFDEAIRLRRYDDMGKVKDMVTPPLESYRSLLEACVADFAKI